MARFNLVNNILGWAVFLVTGAVYILTLEPTVSWWDCGEFITSAFKLEIGHPPGAPFYIILARFFSLFAPGPQSVAFMVNSLSALASAGTVMLLYWSIVHLAKKVTPQYLTSQNADLMVIGSGLLGAFAFAFTDSLWFSAVEAEVYALSSFFTAAVFWAILKWENEADTNSANRWFILIAYLTGLSIGVHLLNLLAIPAMVVVVWFKFRSLSTLEMAKALLAGMLILGTLQYIIIPGIANLAFIFDRFFVNCLGFQFGYGIVFMMVLLATILIVAIFYSHRLNSPVSNLVSTMLLVVLIGYSSYGLILIRAQANPPMNQNQPDNAFALRKYLNREQYGNRPLFYGPYFNAPSIGVKGSKMEFNKVDGKYAVTAVLPGKTRFDVRYETVFPRMYSRDNDHINEYQGWAGLDEPISATPSSEQELKVPSFTENIRFFIRYQVGHMYIRYFMWNFSGRQNDIQGFGNFMAGNWITGFPVIDEKIVGPQHLLPADQKNDPGRNRYFMLPLLLGFVGMFYQFRTGIGGRKSFWSTLLLFLFTGLAIVVYLNQTPLQARERDYAYVGSFYAFSIWIGLALPAVIALLRKWLSDQTSIITGFLISTMLVPGILLAENYDDHNRSGRFMTSAYARNYLESCAPNAILFTWGDNDTFPLWYAQEVEGIRPDIRIINLSLLGMDWYIRQLQYKQNEGDPVKIGFQESDYYTGKLEFAWVADVLKDTFNIGDAIDLLTDTDFQSKLGVDELVLPLVNLTLAVDREKVVQNGTVKPENASLIADSLGFSVTNQYLLKNDIMLLSIISENNWSRPVYFDNSVAVSGSIFFKDYLQLEGLAYRLVPIKTKGSELSPGRIETSSLYENVMNKFTWGNVNDKDVYLDNYNRQTISILMARHMFSRLALALVDEGEPGRAEAVLDRLFEIFPNERIALDHESAQAARSYYKAGAMEKGNRIVSVIAKNTFEKLQYYFSLPLKYSQNIQKNQEDEITTFQNLVILARENNQEKLSAELDGMMQQLINQLEKR